MSSTCGARAKRPIPSPLRRRRASRRRWIDDPVREFRGTPMNAAHQPDPIFEDDDLDLDFPPSPSDIDIDIAPALMTEPAFTDEPAFGVEAIDAAAAHAGASLIDPVATPMEPAAAAPLVTS